MALAASGLVGCFFVDGKGPAHGRSCGFFVTAFPCHGDLAGVGAEAAVDLPSELFGVFVKDGGDIAKAGTAHNERLGSDIGDG